MCFATSRIQTKPAQLQKGDGVVPIFTSFIRPHSVAEQRCSPPGREALELPAQVLLQRVFHTLWKRTKTRRCRGGGRSQGGSGVVTSQGRTLCFSSGLLHQQPGAKAHPGHGRPASCVTASAAWNGRRFNSGLFAVRMPQLEAAEMIEKIRMAGGTSVPQKQ